MNHPTLSTIKSIPSKCPSSTGEWARGGGGVAPKKETGGTLLGNMHSLGFATKTTMKNKLMYFQGGRGFVSI